MELHAPMQVQTGVTCRAFSLLNPPCISVEAPPLLQCNSRTHTLLSAPVLQVYATPGEQQPGPDPSPPAPPAPSHSAAPEAPRPGGVDLSGPPLSGAAPAPHAFSHLDPAAMVLPPKSVVDPALLGARAPPAPPGGAPSPASTLVRASRAHRSVYPTHKVY